MFNKLSFVTVLIILLNCITLSQGNYVNWPIIFLGLGTALVNIGYNIYQDWQKSILMQILEDDGYMEQIERESEEIARKILDKLENEDSDD